MAVVTQPSKRRSFAPYSNAPTYAAVLLLGAIVIVPIAYVALSGFRTTGQLAFDPVSMPHPWVTHNYASVITSREFWRQLGNSAIIGSIQLFDLVWIMTAGGPAGASSTMATYMIDQGINSYRIGYATTVAVILFFICFVFSILYQIFVLRKDMQGGTSRMAG